MVRISSSGEASTRQIPVHRLFLLGLIVLVGVASLVLFFVPRLGYKRTTLKTCFRNAEGLRSGAPVRIAGVEVGIVDRVEVQPEQRECPASVEFTLNTPYKLSVPNDAVAKVEQLGFLGQYYLEIDISKATGSAIQDDAVLRSEELSHHASLEIVKSLIEAGATDKPAAADKPGKKPVGK